MFISKFGTHTLDNKSTLEISLSYMYDHFLRRDYSNVLTMPLDMKGNRTKGLPMKPEDTNDAVSAAFVIQKSINMEQKKIVKKWNTIYDWTFEYGFTLHQQCIRPSE